MTQLHGTRDTLDTFLKDYSQGATKPAVAYGGSIAGSGRFDVSTYSGGTYNKSMGYGVEGGMGAFGSTFYRSAGPYGREGVSTKNASLQAALAHYASQPVGQS